MRPALWIAGLLFFAGILTSNALSQKSLLASSWTLCLFVTAGCFVFLTSVQTPFGILALLLPIFLSAFLLNWKHMFLLIGLVLSAAVYLIFFRPIVYANSLEQWLPIIILLIVSFFLLLITYQLYANLAWFEQNYVSVHKSEQIIRDNEAELKRVWYGLSCWGRSIRAFIPLFGISASMLLRYDPAITNTRSPIFYSIMLVIKA